MNEKKEDMNWYGEFEVTPIEPQAIRPRLSNNKDRLFRHVFYFAVFMLIVQVLTLLLT